MSITPESPSAITELGSSDLSSAYRAANNDVIADLNLGDETGWDKRVADVLVVLCASRSGSSLIFNALSSTGQVAAPGGEHEPWMTLSENKFPFQASDRIDGEVKHRDLLLKLLRNDLLVRDRQVDSSAVITHVRNRLVVRRQQDADGFGETITKIITRGNILSSEWQEVLKDIGRLAMKPMPTALDHFGDINFGLPLENPPLIDQPLAHIASDEELQNLPLLFKSPSDAYRPGFYENLFPNARVNYLHLTRGFVQTTNGLMDGWQKNDVDFISNPVGIAKPLDIEEYSITDMSRAYWCFDLFNGWEEYTDMPLVEVATNQWLKAHTSVVDNFNASGHLTFESFYSNPDDFYMNLSKLTDIDTTGYDWSKSIMSTEPPSQMRWLKRASLFRNLGAHIPGQLMKDVLELQDHLGYRMDEETWR